MNIAPNQTFSSFFFPFCSINVALRFFDAHILINKVTNFPDPISFGRICQNSKILIFQEKKLCMINIRTNIIKAFNTICKEKNKLHYQKKKKGEKQVL